MTKIHQNSVQTFIELREGQFSFWPLVYAARPPVRVCAGVGVGCGTMEWLTKDKGHLLGHYFGRRDHAHTLATYTGECTRPRTSAHKVTVTHTCTH